MQEAPSIPLMDSLLEGGLPADFLRKQASRYKSRYYRGPCKKLRRRADVVAKRKAQKLARRANRGSVRGQKNTGGRRFS
jgi:hypothetical protein